MSDGARTARLTALMAGHAFVFVQLFTHLHAVLSDKTFPIFTLVAFVVPLVGVASAYVALSTTPSNRAGRTAETISLLLLSLIAAAFCWIIAGHLGIVNIPNLKPL